MSQCTNSLEEAYECQYLWKHAYCKIYESLVDINFREHLFSINYVHLVFVDSVFLEFLYQ